MYDSTEVAIKKMIDVSQKILKVKTKREAMNLAYAVTNDISEINHIVNVSITPFELITSARGRITNDTPQFYRYKYYSDHL